MTWTSIHTVPDPFREGVFFKFGSQLFYVTFEDALTSDMGYLLTPPTTETEILEVDADILSNFNIASMYVIDGELRGSGLYPVPASSFIERYSFLYNGTPNNWTTSSIVGGQDTDTSALFGTAPDPTLTYQAAMYLTLGIGAGTDLVGYTTDGLNWTNTTITGADLSGQTAAVPIRPVTVRDDDTYVNVRSSSTGAYEYIPLNGGSWSTPSTFPISTATYQFLNHFWAGEGNGRAFSGIWIRRISDDALMRSTDGGVNFSTTQTDSMATMTIDSNRNSIYMADGREFVVSDVGGSNRLWYFDGSQWVQVDDEDIPADMRGVAVLGGTLYYAGSDNDIYTTDEYTPAADTDAWDAAPMRKPCDIDADSQYIYIAALDSNAQPALIQFSTALDADGSIVFQPGGGTDIGVECSATNPDVIWIAGDFDGNNTVERSTDAGGSFVVEDPGTFAPVTAFDVGPDSDERVLVAAETVGSIGLVNIFETVDGADNWTETNAGLSTPASILAIDRLGVNPEETVFANANNATDRSDYSPNAGYDLDDITTGLPTQDATGVIVG